MSLWFYVSFAPGLLDDARALRSYVVASVALASSGLVIFWFWPTMVPAMASENAVQSAVGWLKRADAAGNACPSLHVAFALFSGGWIDRVARELRVAWWLRAFNALWCAGIIYSTIALRQHVFLDVLAGALLGAKHRLGNDGSSCRSGFTPRSVWNFGVWAVSVPDVGPGSPYPAVERRRRT
jgi:membrane-associated phospholipid phosphatase